MRAAIFLIGKNSVVFLMAIVLMVVASVYVLPAQRVDAIDCNGTVSTEDCLHSDVGTISGNYRTVLNGDGIFEDNSNGSLSLTIPACSGGPATVVQASLSWAIRDSVSAYWEDGVNLSVDAGAAVAVSHDRRYKSEVPSVSAIYSSYTADITAQVLPGTHTYDVTNIDTSGTAGVITTQWGFGIHAVYECPEFAPVDISQKDGLDLSWYGWVEPYGADRSELICESFPADLITARTATVDVFLPGAADADREADLWYVTGTGAEPSPTAFDLLTDVNTPANGGAVLQRLVLTSDDPEWDSYQNTAVTIPIGHEYMCIQNDSSFTAGTHPGSGTANGASMFFGASWFTIPQATTTLTLGDMVWTDTNNNGMLDGSESGICGVDVHLYSEVGSDGKYVAADEGTTPLATTTTACSGTVGEYLFPGLAAGDYIVVIPEAELTGSGTLAGYQSSTGSNGSATGTYEPSPDPDNDVNSDDNGYRLSGVGVVTCAVTLAASSEPTNDGDADNNTNRSVDFGFFQEAKLGDYVWYDANLDGIQDSGETGVENVTARLYDADSDTLLSTMVTDSSGAYQFCYLIAGNYYVVFENLPAGYYFTSSNEGGEASDSDPAPGTGRTADYALSAGQVLSDVDGGIQNVLAATGVEVVTLTFVGGMLATIAVASTAISRRKLHFVHHSYIA